IYHYLAANLAKEEGKHEAAVALYKQSLEHARGSFGKMAFEAWLTAYVKELPEQVSEGILVKLVLAELGGDQPVDYLQRTGLLKEDVMGRELRRLVPSAIIRTSPIRIASESNQSLPKEVLAKDLTKIVAAIEAECGRP